MNRMRSGTQLKITPVRVMRARLKTLPSFLPGETEHLIQTLIIRQGKPPRARVQSLRGGLANAPQSNSNCGLTPVRSSKCSGRGP